LLYAFQLNNKNVPSYVGAFNVFQLQPNLTVLKPGFRVRPDDVANWTGGNWRLRTLIPSSFASRISGLESDLTDLDERMVKQQSNLDTQSKLVEAARQQRDERIAELLGDSKANPATAGLLAEVTEADDQRNASLLEVDRLRRAISTAQQNVRSLIQENNDLANTLQSRLTPKLTALSDVPK
jgi:flagellar biosynthesis chaperone FliJ